MTRPLRELLEAGTPRPWEFEEGDSEGFYRIVSTEDGCVTDELAVDLYEQDAAIIVALVNNADKLIELWEAAREVRHQHNLTLPEIEEFSQKRWDDAHDDLFASVEALRNLMEGDER